MPRPRKHDSRLTFLKMAKAWKQEACQRTMTISTYRVMALAAKTAARVQPWGICSRESEWLSWTASHHARQRENRVRMIGNLLATRTPADRRGEDKPFAQKAEGQPGAIPQIAQSSQIIQAHWAWLESRL